ncbi:MAG: hypothetical protein BWZ07_03292 [Alphaproteobacteria bacterium ADurb.BinA280]|nr:MAG: hypothetical protein BWZ07_03292 [Alphaproteobacteria bacterium ADurb.BinA280]
MRQKLGLLGKSIAQPVVQIIFAFRCRSAKQVARQNAHRLDVRLVHRLPARQADSVPFGRSVDLRVNVARLKLATIRVQLDLASLEQPADEQQRIELFPAIGMPRETFSDQRPEIDRLTASAEQLDIFQHFLERPGILTAAKQIELFAARIGQHAAQFGRLIRRRMLDEGQLVVAVFDEVSQRGIDCDLGCAGKALFVAQHIKFRFLQHLRERGADTIAALRVFQALVVMNALGCLWQ